MTFVRFAVRSSGSFLLLLAIFNSSPEAFAQGDITDLKRAIEQLQAQNRELTRRLNALEASSRGQNQRTQRPSQDTTPDHVRTAQQQPAPAAPSQPPLPAAPASPGTPSKPQVAASTSPPVPHAPTGTTPSVEERVTQLELGREADQSAARSIIQSSLSNLGSKINEYVSLGGSLEVTAGRGTDFTRKITDQISISTAELDFQVRANEWMTGDLSVQFQSATNALFPTNPSFNPSNVDRFTLDKGFITVGDVQRFPLYVKAGLDYLPFGLSTGVHRNDVLSIVNPLTIEAFETRLPMITIGFAIPTPAPGQPPAPVVVPEVRPMVLGPAVSSVAKGMGYQPSFRQKPPNPYTPPPEPPPFYGMIDVYDSNGVDQPNRRATGNMNARLGYQTTGHCGRPYSELQSSLVCPWGLEVNVDYISSIFDSLFLQSEYFPFLAQIGKVPGMAATVKLSFGPFLLIGEWNGAIKDTKFTDNVGRAIRIAPSAWQISLGYQFAWNPWVEMIGGQGDYVAIGYSRTSDLAGATELTGTTRVKVGALPQARMTATAGEWFLPNARIAIEYAHNWDYPIAQGGTGRQSDGVFAALNYNW